MLHPRCHASSSYVRCVLGRFGTGGCPAKSNFVGIDQRSAWSGYQMCLREINAKLEMKGPRRDSQPAVVEAER